MATELQPPPGSNLERELVSSDREYKNQLDLLKACLRQHQKDYIACQYELCDALQMACCSRAEKEAISSKLEEKEQFIAELLEQHDELKRQVDNSGQLDEDKPTERDLHQQLMKERCSNAQLLQNFQTKVNERDRQLEEERYRNQLLERKLEKLSNLPENLAMRLLEEERDNLLRQVEDLNQVVEQSQLKYDKLRKSLENLLAEQEQLEERNLEAIVSLQEQQTDQRVYLDELKRALEDKEQVVQVLQFNLQRSEKRVRNLLGVLKAKELAHKEMVEKLQLKQVEELEQKALQIGSLEGRLAELELDCRRKQAEIVNLNQLEQESRLSKLEEEDKLVEKNRIELEELSKKFENHCREFDCDKRKLELEEARKKLAKSEEILDDLRKDNGRLRVRAKSHEANFGKLREAIKREQTKMVCDYEQRLLQLEAEQSACERNRIRYRRYGTRLRKHLEHLREVHGHICEATACARNQQAAAGEEDLASTTSHSELQESAA